MNCDSMSLRMDFRRWRWTPAFPEKEYKGLIQSPYNATMLVLADVFLLFSFSSFFLYPSPLEALRRGQTKFMRANVRSHWWGGW